MLLAKQGGWSLKQMQKSYSTYLSGSVLHEANTHLGMTICHEECAHTTDCNIFKVHTFVGTHLGAVIACCRVGAYCAFWSWVAGEVAGCRCRVPLQGAAVRVLFALWSLVAAECCLLLVLLVQLVLLLLLQLLPLLLLLLLALTGAASQPDKSVL